LNIDKQMTTITGTGLDDLFRKASSYLNKINVNFNPASLKRSIARQNESTAESRKLTLSEVWKGAVASVKNMAGKSASSQEVIRRSTICSNCEDKTSVSDCMGCGAAGRLATLVSNIRKTKEGAASVSSELRKQYCKHCKCSLALMLVTKYADLEQESSEIQNQRPDHCWLKNTSLNFTKE
jgi:hypothetical protein